MLQNCHLLEVSMVAYVAGIYEEDVRKKESISNLSYFLAVSTAIIDSAFFAGLYQKGKTAIPLTVTNNNLFINICWILRVKVMFQPKKNVALTRVLVSAPRKFLRFTAWMAEQAFLSS